MINDTLLSDTHLGIARYAFCIYKCFLVRGNPLKPLFIIKVTLKSFFSHHFCRFSHYLSHYRHINFTSLLQLPIFVLKILTSKPLVCHITSAVFHITCHIIITSISHHFSNPPFYGYFMQKYTISVAVHLLRNAVCF